MTVLSLVLVGVWPSQSNSESNNHGKAQWAAVVDCLIVWLLSPGDNYVVRKQMLPLFWITAGSKKVSKPTMIAVHPWRPILTHNPVPFYSKVIKPDKSPKSSCVFSAFPSEHRKKGLCTLRDWNCRPDSDGSNVQISKHVTMKTSSCVWGSLHTSSCNHTISEILTPGQVNAGSEEIRNVSATQHRGKFGSLHHHFSG